MHIVSSNYMLVASLCVIVVLYSTGDGTTATAVLPTGNKTFPSLIAFGDSILDTGNNNNRLATTRCDFPPYGRDFPGGIATGRFGNGKVLSDLIAENLGIKAALPAFLDPNLQSEDLASGVCFASSGSGLDLLTAKLQNVIPITDQFNHFKQYIGRLEGFVGHEKAKNIISESLYLISSGNNDILITHSTVLKGYDINAYTTQLVGCASTFLKDLYGLGARKFAYISTLPLGCLPIARTVGGGNCVRVTDQGAVLLNSKLEVEISNLESNLTGAKMIFIDIYKPLLDIIRNPKKYGFEDSAHGCCGTGELEVSYLCNRFNPFTCSDASSYVFWDSIHPSERTYQIIVSKVSNQISKQLSDQI